MTTDFAEWEHRKQTNKQIRTDWATLKVYVAENGLQDGFACVDGDQVVWTSEGEPVVAEGRQFVVIDGLVCV